jgi:hypothetical protein
MDPGCVLGGFRVPVQGPVRGERPMHATMADGGWRMADGGWRMADGGWQ